MTLEASVPGTSVGSPVGLSSAEGYFSAAATEAGGMSVPKNCTASGFQATVYGAQNTSQMEVIVGVQTDLSATGIGPTALNCTVTAASGAPVSCTSTGTTSFTTADFLTLVVLNFTNAADYDNTHVLASFVCQ